MTSARIVRLSWIVACIAAAAVVPNARAQAQTGKSDVAWGAVDGSVRDTSGAFLRGVEIVSIDNGILRARSGAGGSFRIDSITAGPHLVRFRRLGEMPLTVSVVVDPNATTSIDAVLEPMPLTLSRVVVQAKSGELVHLPPGVADRMRNGIGTYITADDIAKEHVRNTVDIFRYVAGLQVVVSNDGMEKAVFNTRGSQTLFGTGCPTGMGLVIDGTPLGGTLGSSQGTLAASTNSAATQGLDVVNPKDIAAIEIYRDPVEVPGSLISNPCGIIYIWTR